MKSLLLPEDRDVPADALSASVALESRSPRSALALAGIANLLGRELPPPAPMGTQPQRVGW